MQIDNKEQENVIKILLEYNDNCFWLSSKDWLGTIYASFGVPRIKDFLGFFNKQFLCSSLVLIHIKKSIEPQITTNNGILVFRSIVGTSFLTTIVDILWSWGRACHMLLYLFVLEILCHPGSPT
jgi:hypothetical protein